jgi:radical SAM protein with 4Fe4S-binding SPASM domain
MTTKKTSLSDLSAQLPIAIDQPLLSIELIFMITSQHKGSGDNNRYTLFPKPYTHMSSELVIRFLDAYFDIHAHMETIQQPYQFVFTGGEPTINAASIFTIMEHIDRYHIDCIPALFTETLIPDVLLDRFIAYHFLFQLSYASDNWGKGSISRRFVTILDKIATAGLPVVLRPMINQANVHTMPDIVQFARDHRVGAVIFNMNDRLVRTINATDDRPNGKQYVDSLFQAMELGQLYGVEILVSELMRFHLKGNYQQLTKLVLLPDGMLTTSTQYFSKNDRGAENSIIGQFTPEMGIEIFENKLSQIATNMLHNVKRHCKSCECFQYCRGRNKNLQLFRETLALKKDEYRCEMTRDIYRRLRGF